MIKLQKGDKPSYLTDIKVNYLIKKFELNPKSTVWKHPEIGKFLLKSSNFKCAYCECELQKTDSYLQIEHFKDKDRYPESVVDWDNLLPSCQRCNRRKWTLDVIFQPIINPYVDEPKLHLSQNNFRLYAKDDKGKLTIKKLVLNDDERLVTARFYASNEIAKQLSEIIDNLNNIDYVRESICKTLLSCQANKPFSAFVSATLHSNEDYCIIKETLIKNTLWDDDLIELDKSSKKIALDPR